MGCEKMNRAKNLMHKAVENHKMSAKLNILCRYLDENFNDISSLYEDTFDDSDGETYEMIDFIEKIAKQQSVLSSVAFAKCCEIIEE